MKPKKYISNAKIDFEKTTWDVYHIFDIHDGLIGNKLTTKQKEKADVLVRSTYLFITACWEIFIEDLCEEAFSSLITNIKTQDWKRIVLEKRKKELIRGLHNPIHENIDSLYSDTIGIEKLSNNWKWDDMSIEKSKQKLKNYISVRGAIAHRSRSSQKTSRQDAENYLEFIKVLVEKTETAIQNYVKKISDNYFGEQEIVEGI